MSALRIACLAAAIHASTLGDSAPLALPFPDSHGRISVPLPKWPSGGQVDIPWNGAGVAAAFLNTSPTQYVYSWELRNSGRTLHLDLKRVGKSPVAPVLTLETLSNTQTLADGRYHFPIAAARVERQTNATITYSWEFHPTRPGTYVAETVAGATSISGEVVEVGFDGEWAMGLLNGTDGKSHRIQTSVGRLQVSGTEPRRLYLRLGEGRRVSAEVVAVVLRPTSEGGHLLGNRSDGQVILPAGEVAIHGTQARLDPATGTITHWSLEADQLAWDFHLRHPGHYRVDMSTAGEVAGSEIELSLGDARQRVGLDPNPAGIVSAGGIDVPVAGDQSLRVRLLKRPVSGSLGIREIRLVPTGPAVANSR